MFGQFELASLIFICFACCGCHGNDSVSKTSELHLEATPVVFGMNTVTAVPKEWIETQNKKAGNEDFRQKREYKLDEFLLYMPSGDGPIEDYKVEREARQWIKQFTRTVTITQTVFETIGLPFHPLTAPTKPIKTHKTTGSYEPYGYISAFKKGGKDLSGKVFADTYSHCQVFFREYFNKYIARGNTTQLQNEDPNVYDTTTTETVFHKVYPPKNNKQGSTEQVLSSDYLSSQSSRIVSPLSTSLKTFTIDLMDSLPFFDILPISSTPVLSTAVSSTSSAHKENDFSSQTLFSSSQGITSILVDSQTVHFSDLNWASVNINPTTVLESNIISSTITSLISDSQLTMTNNILTTTSTIKTSIEQDKPTTERNEPTTQRDESTTQRNEPTTQRDESTTQRDEPTTQRDKSTTQRDEPTTEKDKPTTKKDTTTQSIQDATPSTNISIIYPDISFLWNSTPWPYNSSLHSNISNIKNNSGSPTVNIEPEKIDIDISTTSQLYSETTEVSKSYKLETTTIFTTSAPTTVDLSQRTIFDQWFDSTFISTTTTNQTSFEQFDSSTIPSISSTETIPEKTEDIPKTSYEDFSATTESLIQSNISTIVPESIAVNQTITPNIIFTTESLADDITKPTDDCKCDNNTVTESNIGAENASTHEQTLPIPISPSPSNGFAAPLHKKYWIRTILVGPPEGNLDKFKQNMTYKLTKAYQTAYIKTKTLLKMRDERFAKYAQKVMEMNRKNVTNSTRRKRNHLMGHTPIWIENLRIRRETEDSLSVRLHEVNYFNVSDTTELVYSVFQKDKPILAIEAVGNMSAIDDMDMALLLNQRIALKAREYLHSSESLKTYWGYSIGFWFGLIFGLLATISLTTWIVYLIYRNKATQDNFVSAVDIESGGQSSVTGPSPETLGHTNKGFSASPETHTISGKSQYARRLSKVSSNGNDPSGSFLPQIYPSNKDPIPHPRKKHLSPARRPLSGEIAIQGSSKNYTTVDFNRKTSIGSDEILQVSGEPIYSTPKATSCVPQYHANIQNYLISRNDQIITEDKCEFTGPDSLPKFLPPSKPQFPQVPSPAQKRCPLLSSHSESDESEITDVPATCSDLLPSQVEEDISHYPVRVSSRNSSDLDTNSDTPSENGAKRLRRRFHDMLDDAFSLMQGQKSNDKVSNISPPSESQRSRTKSAKIPRRPFTIEDKDRPVVPGRPSRESQSTKRPWSAAPLPRSLRDTTKATLGDSFDATPPIAWGGDSRAITPVNLAHTSPPRPASASARRSSISSRRNSTPLDPETGLKITDPAVPLIRAIKEELHRFKSSSTKDPNIE